MKLKRYLILLLFIGLILISAKFLIGFYGTANWNKADVEIVSCFKNNLLKVKDVEGNTFVFNDIQENANFKTNNITFNEQKLRIQSLAKITDVNNNLNYISKNNVITFNKLENLQSCFKQSFITVSNNYDFNRAMENKFCSFVLNNDESYKLDKCE